MEQTLTVGELTVYVEGAGEDTLVFLHGWPDTHQLWRRQIDFFCSHYRCVSFTLPGFDAAHRRDYSLDNVIESIGAVCDAISPGKPVTLVVHDWGCVFGYEFAMRHSERVQRMVALDVGDINSQELQRSLSLAGKLMVFTYQIVLAISFVIPKPMGNWLARLVARALQARSDLSRVHAGMSMPYAMRWFGSNGGLKHLQPVEPTFPFFYGYATGKPMMFHAPQWIQRIQEKPGNRVEAFACSHWLMVDEADAVNRAIDEWLRQPVSPVAQAGLADAR